MVSYAAFNSASRLVRTCSRADHVASLCSGLTTVDGLTCQYVRPKRLARSGARAHGNKGRSARIRLFIPIVAVDNSSIKSESIHITCVTLRYGEGRTRHSDAREGVGPRGLTGSIAHARSCERGTGAGYKAIIANNYPRIVSISCKMCCITHGNS